jgi:nitrite reductase/ring-hydroxylating ferredoxin subunit
MSEIRATRRIVFQGLGALGVAAALAGCGGGSDGGSAAEPETGAVLTPTADVPVGGGVVLDGVVVTQPTEGEFKAFTAVCTHQGTQLDAVNDDGIRCPLHGSYFSITDGSATQGPATTGLSEVSIEVRDGQVLAA